MEVNDDELLVAIMEKGVDWNEVYKRNGKKIESERIDHNI